MHSESTFTDMQMKNILTLSFLLVSASVFANKTSAEIYKELQKLHSLNHVLYFAAHPDDENTRVLAYFSLNENAETAYFSLTRGDGGQNLIGKELSEDLGVLRTQELLSARSYDRAKQFFSRAVDFGFSKSAEESLAKWNKDSVLSDAVLMLRKFKPDVIITRFPPDKRAGHGHHTASAMIAIEAFQKAADPNFFPEQVAEFGTWQAKSLYWNTSSWAQKDIEKVAVNNPDYLAIDMGAYDPVLGKSYNEIGTIARSQHKCQGFGAIIERGRNIEYFQYLAGEKLKKSFFENNSQSWEILVNKGFSEDLEELMNNFDFKVPENNVVALLKIKQGLSALPASLFKEEKLNLCNRIIGDCLGLYIEAVANDYAFASNDEIEYTLRIVNRSTKQISFNGKNINPHSVFEEKEKVSAKNEISNPYWLQAPFKDLYIVSDKKDLLKAESDATYEQTVSLSIKNETVAVTVPLEHVWREPAFGEKRRRVINAPTFTVNFDQKNLVLKPEQETEIKLTLHDFGKQTKDTLQLIAPQGWQLSQTTFPLSFDKKQQEQFISVSVKAGSSAQSGELKCVNSKREPLLSKTEIAYNHIPAQTIFKPAQITCVKLDVQIKKGKIAYIKGAEDVVPQAIAQLGFEVQTYEVTDLASLNLSEFGSVVLGIRIYNVYPELHNFENKLFDYVQQGGNLVIQYNTASRFMNDNVKLIERLPFTLTDKRVTEEDAVVTFLEPNSALLNYPNKISQQDFENWIQERGLYFATDWDKDYKPVLSWQDKGETAQTGALIAADYGKGRVIYTGISFFRELPAGVEGAYRLFANLLSYEPKQ